MGKTIKSVAVISILAVACGLAILLSTRTQAASEKGTSPYLLAPVEPGMIAESYAATGTLNPTGSVSVGSTLSGTVESVSADFNQSVKAGQLLARLDTTSFRAALAQAQADRDVAAANVALAESTLHRDSDLVAQGFLSASALDSQRRDLATAVAQHQQAEARIAAAAADMAHTEIRSPIDGVVLKRNVEVGQTVAASFQTPDLFQIAKDLKEMQIVASVSEGDVGAIREGLPVNFVVEAYPNRIFHGRVRQIRLSGTAHDGGVIYDVIVGVANPELLLKPGMTANVEIIAGRKESALRVATNALRYHAESDSAEPSASAKPLSEGNGDGRLYDEARMGAVRASVYTVNAQGALERHEVGLGVSNAMYSEILSSDLKVGQLVVIGDKKK